MKNRKTKKIWKGVLIGVALSVATLVVGMIVLVYLFFAGPPAKVTRDIEDYEKVLGYPYLQTAYIVFPEKLPEGIQESEFYSYYRDTFGSPTIQTYMKCKYDEESYQEEIERLENTSKKYANREKKLLRDPEKKFQYPAYIAVENAAHKYEYALLTGDCEIVYINTAWMEKEDMKCPREYLPYDFMTEEGREFGSGYSIYYASVSSSAIDTDYTRDLVTEVRDSHMVILDDYHFMVRVILNEQGKEMIEDCLLYRFDAEELMKGKEAEEVILEELKGMEYKDMELDRERGVVCITYLDGDVENTKEYEMVMK